ncbi:MAG: transcriptional regulator [Halobacteriovorax sp.]|nr:transcriptional regulator [Halobacteriovorax sp.]|tara:strand:- start:13050 stop:13496 length:447 start_codon:yes stop_codon:yes gene_type:complete
MLKINRKVEYALMALKFMASKPVGNLTSAREICEHFNVPFDTTAKVLQTMNTRGLLNSVKGIRGGYHLEKSLDEITYMQLARMVEGKEEGQFCHNSKGEVCELYTNCNIVDPLEQLNKKLNAYLESLSLKELLFDDKDPIEFGERMEV